jgi:hypothetical protein
VVVVVVAVVVDAVVVVVVALVVTICDSLVCNVFARVYLWECAFGCVHLCGCMCVQMRFSCVRAAYAYCDERTGNWTLPFRRLTRMLTLRRCGVDCAARSLSPRQV